jgi:hypothetical protein
VQSARQLQQRRRERVADRDRERIGGMRRRRCRLQPQDRLRHLLHLRLLRPTITADGLLDRRRRILDTRDAGCRAGDQDRATHLPNRERHPWVTANERLLNRDRVRPILADQRRLREIQLAEPYLDPLIRHGVPAAKLVGFNLPPADVDDAVPARGKPRVDTDNTHPASLETEADETLSPRTITTVATSNGPRTSTKRTGR